MRRLVVPGDALIAAGAAGIDVARIGRPDQLFHLQSQPSLLHLLQGVVGNADADRLGAGDKPIGDLPDVTRGGDALVLEQTLKPVFALDEADNPRPAAAGPGPRRIEPGDLAL